MSERIERLPERPEDAAFRYALFCESHGTIFSGLDEQLRSTILRQQFSMQDAGYRAVYRDARFDIVMKSDERVGRIVTATAAGVLMLVDLAIAVAAQRRGIATRLLNELFTEAQTTHRVVQLQVTLNNFRARRFYEKLGFAVIEASDFALTMEAVSR